MIEKGLAWTKARLNEPSTHAALSAMFTLATMFAPAKEQPFVLGAAIIFGALGFALPDGLNKKVIQAEEK